MEQASRFLTLIRIFLASSIGIFVFFVPITINNNSTIFLDHASTFIITELRFFAISAILVLMFYGAVMPFYKGHFRNSVGKAIFDCLKLLGLILAILYLTGYAPAFAMQKDMLPFLFEKLALSVGILIPLGGIALTFLIGFGFLEMVGVLMERVMRPLFRTPGYSAVDAVTSFVGSYSIGLLITNRMYTKGRYSFRDAVITATGFSTVSATFMVIVAKTLGLMEFWNFYFWATFFVTFVVTTITAYLPPISRMDASYPHEEPEAVGGNRLSQAMNAGITHFHSSPKLLPLLYSHLKEGLAMSAIVAPTILAVGFIGLCISKYTPFFEWLGFVLKPFLMLTGIEGASAHSGAFASGLAEMFLPAILLKDAEFSIRFIAAITSVSSVLFLSGCIPCILATTIPVKMKDLLLIWFMRTGLSIVLSGAVVWFGLQVGWIS